MSIIKNGICAWSYHVMVPVVLPSLEDGSMYFKKILLALFIQIIEVKNGVRVIGRLRRYGYGIAVCRNNLRRGPVFLHFLIFSLASKMPALLHAASPAGYRRKAPSRPSGIVTVMFVSGSCMCSMMRCPPKPADKKTTASMKTASRQPIKRMLFSLICHVCVLSAYTVRTHHSNYCHCTTLSRKFIPFLRFFARIYKLSKKAFDRQLKRR